MKGGKNYAGTFKLSSGQMLKGSQLNVQNSAILAGGIVNGKLSGTGNVAVTGEVATVESTPFDFRIPTRIGERINDTTHQQIVNGRGYDHNWILATHGDISAVAGILYDPTTGIEMRIHTDQPGVQFYAGNFLDGSFMGKNGVAYPRRSGLCFETQHFPDSPNQPAFPSTTLRPGETYTTTTIYKFDIRL